MDHAGDRPAFGSATVVTTVRRIVSSGCLVLAHAFYALARRVALGPVPTAMRQKWDRLGYTWQQRAEEAKWISPDVARRLSNSGPYVPGPRWAERT